MNAETESHEASGQALEGGLRFLARAQRISGGWSYRADLPEAALEPTVWALLSLRAHGRLGADVAQRGLAYVRKTQRADGGFARSPADEAPSDWHSFLAVFCLRCLSDAPEAVRRGLAWTREFHALRATNTNPAIVGHDPTLEGWPWTQGTSGWAEPTAYALMALKVCGRGEHARAREGRAMLLDRAIEGGGWNYGNTVVLGKKYTPIPAVTGVVLTALRHLPNDAAVRGGVRYLRDRLPVLRSSLSLAWSVIALKLLAPQMFETHQAEAEVNAALAAALSRTMDGTGNALHIALLLLASQPSKPWPFDAFGIARTAGSRPAGAMP